MRPSPYAMLDELAKIAEEQKAIEEKKKETWHFPSGDEWKEVGKSMLGYGLGMGLGTAGGYALRQKVLPKVLPQMGDKMLTALSLGGGALAGLGSAAALRHMLGKANDARKRDD